MRASTAANDFCTAAGPVGVSHSGGGFLVVPLELLLKCLDDADPELHDLPVIAQLQVVDLPKYRQDFRQALVADLFELFELFLPAIALEREDRRFEKLLFVGVGFGTNDVEPSYPALRFLFRGAFQRLQPTRYFGDICGLFCAVFPPPVAPSA